MLHGTFLGYVVLNMRLRVNTRGEKARGETRQMQGKTNERGGIGPPIGFANTWNPPAPIFCPACSGRHLSINSLCTCDGGYCDLVSKNSSKLKGGIIWIIVCVQFLLSLTQTVETHLFLFDGVVPL